MQIMTILGSARKKGNTATVTGWVEDEMRSMGHDVARIYLNNKTINGSLGCDKDKAVGLAHSLVN
jgi:multimeric flavodoxin WrbA